MHVDGPKYFFLSYLVLITTSLAISSIFRLLGSLFQNPSGANAVGGFLLLMLVINSGYIIVRTALPPWTICFYWISPFAYSIRALAINEFTSPRWQHQAGTQPGSKLGDESLEAFAFYTERCLLATSCAGHVSSRVDSGCPALFVVLRAGGLCVCGENQVCPVASCSTAGSVLFHLSGPDSRSFIPRMIWRSHLSSITLRHPNCPGFSLPSAPLVTQRCDFLEFVLSRCACRLSALACRPF
jgi:hypothetical protein